jgi:Na+/glutamate symporter
MSVLLAIAATSGLVAAGVVVGLIVARVARRRRPPQYGALRAQAERFLAEHEESCR